MSVDRGLEVVIPRGFDRRKIRGLLEEKRAWIERTAARMDARRRHLEAEPPRLPERIVLPAVDEEWTVEYRSAASRSAGSNSAVARERPGRRLVVTGDPDDSVAYREALCRWLSRRARAALVPRLAELALRHRLEYGRVSVRQQRTRWGSCSRRKTVSLNARLLFLPPDLVDYVLLHELCHTVEMNHSPRFWTLLGYHEPGCRAHRKLLRRAGEAVPTWLDQEVGEPAI
jgi:predicted metal-dependent hydrolase